MYLNFSLSENGQTWTIIGLLGIKKYIYKPVLHNCERFTFLVTVNFTRLSADQIIKEIIFYTIYSNDCEQFFEEQFFE